MSRLRSTAATLPACIILTVALTTALTACQDSSQAPATEPTVEPTTSSPAAVPQAPSFVGRLGVVVQAGLGVVSEDACTRVRNRVCSVDGQDAYVPIEGAAPATLVEVGARLADRHTSWTTLLRFDAASRSALVEATHSAASVGGMVLVMTADRHVLLAAPYPQVAGRTIRLTDLDKPEAWHLVEPFAKE